MSIAHLNPESPCSILGREYALWQLYYYGYENLCTRFTNRPCPHDGIIFNAALVCDMLFLLRPCFEMG